jgi:hypothetical protein
MSLSIFLKKTNKRWKAEELVELVKAGKSRVITIDNLSCLKKILPDKSEVDEIQSFCHENPENVLRLAEPDRSELFNYYF